MSPAEMDLKAEIDELIDELIETATCAAEIVQAIEQEYKLNLGDDYVWEIEDRFDAVDHRGFFDYLESFG